MTTYTIRIDRRSIRRKKNAGSTESAVHHGQTITGRRLKMRKTYNAIEEFTAKTCKVVYGGPGKWIFKPRGIHVTAEQRYAPDDPDFYREFHSQAGAVTPVEPKDKQIIHIEVSTDVHRFQHAAIPDFDYIYRSAKVTCGECGKTFGHKTLVSDSAEWADGYAQSSRVCPHCNEWDCCDLNYQKLDDQVLAQCARRNKEREKRRSAK